MIKFARMATNRAMLISMGPKCASTGQSSEKCRKKQNDRMLCTIVSRISTQNHRNAVLVQRISVYLLSRLTRNDDRCERRYQDADANQSIDISEPPRNLIF
jgi:hypothetical protein